tara:strand:- start:11170 stop:11433 length:264 start_codon:yes stop_codon:yes gene_type:complete
MKLNPIEEMNRIRDRLRSVTDLKTLQQGVKDIEERVDLEAALAKTKGKMDLIVAKQRMGKLGKCTVEVDMGTNVFRDMPEESGNLEF